MKKLLVLIVTLSMCAFLCTNCSEKDENTTTPPIEQPEEKPEEKPSEPPAPESNIHPDSVIVGVNPIIHIDSEPLSSRASNNDLYAIAVSNLYYYTNELGIDWIGTNTCACGYFDDLSKAIFKLAKRDKYGVTVAYIPNGKELIYKYPDGHYGAPCGNSAINQIVYNEPTLNLADASQTSLSSDNIWNSIERYQGVTVNFDPKTSTTAHVKLYKMAFGLKLDISDFHSGVITIAGMPNMSGHTYSIYPDGNGNGFLDIIIESPTIPTVGDIEPYPLIYPDDPYGENYEQVNDFIESRFDGGSTQLHIQYTTENGEILNLYNNINFVYTRNTKYKLNFSLQDAIKNGGITTDIKENEE